MHLPSTSSGECRICALTSASAPQHSYDHAWAQTDNYFALASIGALVPGWSLVFPERHTLNLTDHYSDPAFWEFVSTAHTAVEKRYGRSVIFEHGCQHSGSETGCGTSHAHLHIVPLSEGLVLASKDYDPSLVWENCVMRDIPQRAGRNEYLFVADFYAGDSTVGALALLHEGRSQYFRRVVAQMVGRSEEYDYRQHPHTDVAARSAFALRADAARLQQASAA